MKKLLTLLIALSGSVALADFTKPDDVESLAGAPAPAVFAKGRAAAVGLTLRSTNDQGESAENFCSATQISNDGYFLTAMHCLPSCSFIKSGSVKGGTFIAADLAKIQKGKAKCSLLVTTDDKSRSRTATAVAAGIGYVVGDAKQSPAVAALVGQGYSVTQDWVILKFDQGVADGCVKTNAAAPTIGEGLWNLGFPIETSRPHNNAPGEKLVFSNGVVTSVGTYVVSTLDLVPGSSGSGEFDQNGDLIAMSRAINLGKADSSLIFKQAVPGSAEAIPVATILHDMGLRYGSAVVNQAFNCY